MTRFLRNRAILAKVEATYGTDSVPTGAANAMQMTNVVVNPLQGSEARRDLVVPEMGHQGIILTENHITLSGEVEISGAGAAGSVPAWGALMRMCGFAETINAGVDVQYTPVSVGHESGSIYFNADGVNHVLLGTRGTFTLDLMPSQIARFKFSFTGLLGNVADTALPVVDLSGFTTPVPVDTNNSSLSLHGYAGAAESLSLDMGNQVQPRFLIGSESVVQTDREITGQVVMEADTLAAVDWFAIARAHTKGALAVTHGLTAGNIVEFSADAVQIGRPTLGETQGILNNTLPIMLTTSGADEFTITVK